MLPTKRKNNIYTNRKVITSTKESNHKIKLGHNKDLFPNIAHLDSSNSAHLDIHPPPQPPFLARRLPIAKSREVLIPGPCEPAITPLVRSSEGMEIDRD
jgi:hypothetical protein